MAGFSDFFDENQQQQQQKKSFSDFFDENQPAVNVPQEGVVQKAFKSALDVFTSVLEPAEFGVRLVEATAADIGSLATGKPTGELRELFGQFPKYAPLGAKPEVTINGEELLKKFGVKDESVALWGGIAIDFLADPLLASSWVRAVGKAAQVAGATEDAKKLFTIADKVERAVSPAAAVEKVKKLAPGPTESMTAMLERLFEARTPFRVISQEAKVAGIREPETRATVREALFPMGRVPGGRTFEEGLDTVPTKAFFGGEDIGPGILRLSRGTRSKFEHIISGTIRQVDGLYKQIDPKRGAAYRALDDIVGARIRDLNVIKQPEITEFATDIASKGVSHPRDIESWTNRALENANQREQFVERVKKFRELFAPDKPLEDVLKIADTAAAKLFATQITVGYHLSEYENFVKLVERAVNEAAPVGSKLDSQTMLLHLWESMRLGKKPDEVTTKWLDGESRAAREVLKRLKVLMKENPGFRRMDPFEYMSGVAHGFITKIGGRFADPGVMEDIAANWDVVLFDKEVPPEKIASVFTETLGEQAGQVVQKYLETLPAPAVRIDDLLETLQRTGAISKRVTADNLRDILGSLSEDYLAVEETLQMIGQGETRRARLRDVLVAAAGERSQKLKMQYDIETLHQLIGGTKQMALLGAEAPRELGHQTLLKLAAEELRRIDMIQPAAPTPRSYLGSVVMINVPNDPRVWGELAGTSIPLWAMREILKIIKQPGEGRLSSWQRFVNVLRKGFLSGWKTTARNIVSNMGLLYAAGLPVDEIVQQLPRARKMVLEYASTGYSKDLAGAEHMLTFLHDSSLSKWFQNADDELFYRIVAQKHKNAKTLDDYIRQIDQAVDKFARTPQLGGFLGTFQAAEDYTRAAVFLWARDRLMSQGVSKEEAVKRAAHLAINSTYDYTHVGAALDWLRKTGLSLFPSFAYFTVGRVTRAAFERPSRLVMPEKIITAANQALIPDEEERQRITLMTSQAEYLTEHPLVIPADKDGHYYVIPLDYFLPQAIVSPRSSLGDLFAEPTFGGALRPFVDATYAWLSGSGEPTPLTAKYGQRVFEKYQTQGERVTSTVGFIAKQYLPGTMRDIYDFFSKRLPNYMNPEAAKVIAQYTGRYTNSNPEQLMLRYLAGVSTYEVDVTGDVSLNGALKRLAFERDEKLKQLRAKLKIAAIRGDSREISEIQSRIISIEEEYVKQVQQILQGVR